MVLASEPMDDDVRWQLIPPGELIHVNTGLHVNRRLALPDPPKIQLDRAQLSAAAAAAQHPST